MVKFFEISGLKLRCEMPFVQNISYETIPFISDNNYEECNLNFRFIPVDFLELPEQTPFYEVDTRHFLCENSYVIFHSNGSKSEPYAKVTWRYDDPQNIICEYISDRVSQVNYSRNFFNLMGLENLHLLFDGFLLHSSFINYSGNGIIFTAPSGTGKSTQADLWAKYEGADILNGDRAGIRRLEDGWRAWGLPYAGTSGIYRNESAPIKAIIVLRQAKDNKIRKLSAVEAMRYIYPEVTIHRWDPKFVDKVVNLLLDLLTSVPVYLLECLPDKGAVDILKSEIFAGEEKL